MNNTGIRRSQAFGARQSSPIEGVLVTVSGNGFTAQRITDETGTAADLSIEAPSCALSLQEDNTIRPYAVVDLTAAKAGFRTVRIQGVQIFAGQVTLAQPEMIPETEEDRDVVNPPIVIPEHSLFTGDGGSGPDPMENCVPRVLDRVIIPKNITVHPAKSTLPGRSRPCGPTSTVRSRWHSTASTPSGTPAKATPSTSPTPPATTSITFTDAPCSM